MQYYCARGKDNKMDKHYCSQCGMELNARDMCGFTEEPTCFKCGYTPTEDLRIAWYLFLFIPLLVLLYGVTAKSF